MYAAYDKSKPVYHKIIEKRHQVADKAQSEFEAALTSFCGGLNVLHTEYAVAVTGNQWNVYSALVSYQYP